MKETQMKNEPLILVTGATGKTGGAVVRQLLERGVPVRAMVRRADSRSRSLEQLGAQTVIADAFDSDAMAQAMRGVRRAYYCPPWHPNMVHSAAVFAVAARDAGLESIVSLSQWLASPQHPSLATRQNWLSGHIFDMVPNAVHTTIAPGFFADNYLTLIGFAAQLGLFPMPMGKGRNAPPSNEDIARVAVGALLDPGTHAGRTYRPTGPELLSAQDMARIIGDVVGRTVRHLEMPMWMFMKAVRVLGPRFGVDGFQQVGLKTYIEEHKLGTFEMGAPTNHVKLVSGRDPEDFATIVRRYAKHPEAKRNFVNWLSTVADFMRIGMTPALNLSQLVNGQLHPVIRKPELAANSAVWKLTHLDTLAPGLKGAHTNRLTGVDLSGSERRQLDSDCDRLGQIETTNGAGKVGHLRTQ